MHLTNQCRWMEVATCVRRCRTPQNLANGKQLLGSWSNMLSDILGPHTATLFLLLQRTVEELDGVCWSTEPRKRDGTSTPLSRQRTFVGSQDLRSLSPGTCRRIPCHLRYSSPPL